MATRDHLMGYAPAAYEWFGDDDDVWTWFLGQYPLGMPNRVRDEHEAKRRNIELQRQRELRRPIIRIDHRYSTARDITGSAVKRQLALDAARPIAEAMGLHIETASDVRDRLTGELHRHVERYEPEPPRYLVIASRKLAEADAHACRQEQQRRLDLG